MASDDTERQQLLALRRAISTTINGLRDVADALLAAVDAVDGDPDLEDDDDEPSLGRPNGSQATSNHGGSHDVELDPGEDDTQLGWADDGGQARLHGLKDEYEPSLGSIGSCCGTDLFPQSGWARGTFDDREDEHDGSEPDQDGEPTLGWTEAGEHGDTHDDGENEPSLGWTSSGSSRGSTDDREHDPAEHGIADVEGASEQGFNGYTYGHDGDGPLKGGHGL